MRGSSQGGTRVWLHHPPGDDPRMWGYVLNAHHRVAGCASAVDRRRAVRGIDGSALLDAVRLEPEAKTAQTGCASRSVVSGGSRRFIGAGALPSAPVA